MAMQSGAAGPAAVISGEAVRLPALNKPSDAAAVDWRGSRVGIQVGRRVDVHMLVRKLGRTRVGRCGMV